MYSASAVEQATDVCNYVFYKQNNGFFSLYLGAKDALLSGMGAVKWWWDVRRTPSFTTHANVSEMQLALFQMTNPKAEIVEKDDGEPVTMPDGTQLATYTVKIGSHATLTPGQRVVAEWETRTDISEPADLADLIDDAIDAAHRVLRDVGADDGHPRTVDPHRLWLGVRDDAGRVEGHVGEPVCPAGYGQAEGQGELPCAGD